MEMKWNGDTEVRTHRGNCRHSFPAPASSESAHRLITGSRMGSRLSRSPLWWLKSPDLQQRCFRKRLKVDSWLLWLSKFFFPALANIKFLTHSQEKYANTSPENPGRSTFLHAHLASKSCQVPQAQLSRPVTHNSSRWGVLLSACNSNNLC